MKNIPTLDFVIFSYCALFIVTPQSAAVKNDIRPIVEAEDDFRPIVELEDDFRPIVETEDDFRPIVEAEDDVEPIAGHKLHTEYTFKNYYPNRYARTV